MNTYELLQHLNEALANKTPAPTAPQGPRLGKKLTVEQAISVLDLLREIDPGNTTTFDVVENLIKHSFMTHYNDCRKAIQKLLVSYGVFAPQINVMDHKTHLVVGKNNQLTRTPILTEALLQRFHTPKMQAILDLIQ